MAGQLLSFAGLIDIDAEMVKDQRLGFDVVDSFLPSFSFQHLFLRPQLR